MNNTILSIRGVSKHYTTKTALDKIDMEIPKGSIYGLLGPNGAGKTSLIRIINQITQADEGEVFLNGEKLGPSHIGSIGYLPEERGLYKKAGVYRQLQYFAQLRGLSYQEAGSRAMYWLEKLGLADVKNKKTEELSKGMQQKVQFIVAVIHSPELLILDEPFSGFDPINAELLTSVILELRQKGCTVIFSTHRMESVEQLCDNMAMIHLSKKILEGKVSDIRKQFSNGAYEIISKTEIQLPQNDAEILSHAILPDASNRYTLRLKEKTGNELLTDILKQTELLSYRQHLPDMHDIFIQMVSQNS